MGFSVLAIAAIILRAAMRQHIAEVAMSLEI
jgi:hypothetical protein